MIARSRFTLLCLFSLVPLLGFGCGTEADLGDAPDDEADAGPATEVSYADDDLGVSEDALSDPGTKARFSFLQAGFFPEFPDPPGRVPRLLHIGYVTAPGNSWAGITDIPVLYSAEKNKAILITPPAEYQGRLLAYTIKYEERGSYGAGSTYSWTPDAYVDLKRPAGKFLYFPVSNVAPYPFENECYRIQVRGPRDGAYGPTYNGKVKSLSYAFSKATIAQWEQNPDVAWVNERDLPGMVGTLDAVQRHDGGYKGAYRMVPLWTRVPSSRRLVYKLKIAKYGGFCGYSGDSYLDETVQTQTYMWPNPPPLVGP